MLKAEVVLEKQQKVTVQLSTPLKEGPPLEPMRLPPRWRSSELFLPVRIDDEKQERIEPRRKLLLEPAMTVQTAAVVEEPFKE